MCFDLSVECELDGWPSQNSDQLDTLSVTQVDILPPSSITPVRTRVQLTALFKTVVWPSLSACISATRADPEVVSIYPGSWKVTPSISGIGR